MYISEASGTTYFRGRLYDLAASEIFIRKYPSTKHSPDREKTIYPPTQEVLEYLFNMGHKGILKVEDVKKTSAKKIETVKKTEEEE